LSRPGKGQDRPKKPELGKETWNFGKGLLGFLGTLVTPCLSPASEKMDLAAAFARGDTPP
jgi:hypothetical protein